MSMLDRHRHVPRHAEPGELLESERGRRALEAMAAAAHRAREQRDEPGAGDRILGCPAAPSTAEQVGEHRLVAWTVERHPSAAPPIVSAPAPQRQRSRDLGHQDPSARSGGERALVVAIAVVVILDAVALGAVLALRTYAANTLKVASTPAVSGRKVAGGTTVRRGSGATDNGSSATTTPPSSAGTGSPFTAPTAPRRSASEGGTAMVPATSRSSTGTSFGIEMASGGAGAPHISSLGPSSGVPGDTIAVTGSALYSESGEVTAYLGGHPAPTRCPSRNTCTVTVPDLGPVPSTLTLVVATSAGTSNAIAFSYE